jgi:hypothetical protein
MSFAVSTLKFLIPSSFPSLVVRLESLVVSLLLSYSVDVRSIDLVPSGHVLFHAGSHTGLFAAGERAAGLGDALFEAVFLELL